MPMIVLDRCPILSSALSISFSAVGLPARVTLNATTGELTEPLQGGTYNITVTASNAFGSSQEIINLRVSEVSGFTHFLS